eukprot:SAG11_NODE_1736_length_4344_cov_1.763722_1_plen_161_part_00
MLGARAPATPLDPAIHAAAAAAAAATAAAAVAAATPAARAPASTRAGCWLLLLLVVVVIMLLPLLLLLLLSIPVMPFDLYSESTLKPPCSAVLAYNTPGHVGTLLDARDKVCRDLPYTVRPLSLPVDLQSQCFARGRAQDDLTRCDALSRPRAVCLVSGG